MTAGARIPDVWRSSRIGHTSAIETILYLLVPWLLDLPWSILYHIAMFHFVTSVNTNGFASGPTGVFGLALLYLVAFFPALVTGFLCRRRDPNISRRRAMLLGHSFVAMNYLSWACSWRALYRIIRRQTTWDKTTHHAEDVALDAIVVKAPASA
jgi:hypothetical protein